MTIGGFLREVEAAQRRAARNEERRLRFAERAAKLQAKINELQRAAAEVEEFNERVQHLTSIHHTVGEEMDWRELAQRAAPPEPKKHSRWETEALRAKNDFKPTFWQRIFNRAEKIRAQLEKNVIEARQRDSVSHQGALKLFQNQLEQWRELNRLANAIVRGELKAYREALE